MNLFAITNLLCGTFCLLLGIFALLAGKNKIYQLLAWFNIAVSFWGFGTFAASISLNELDAVKAWRIAHSGGFFIGAFFYHLVCSLIGIQHKKIQLFGYAQAVFFIILTCATPWVLHQTRSYYNFIYVIATPLYALAVSFYIFYVLLSFIELGRYMSKAQGDKKLQVQCFFYGFFIGFTGGTSLLLPEFYLDWVYPAGNAGVFIYAAIITYAVLKNRILDVQEIADAFQREKMAVLGTMAASLNHEIKNPLFVVRGKAECYLDALERRKYSSSEELYEAGKSAVNPILNQVTRALDIIQKFTDFARPFNAKGSKETVVLSEVFQDVRELVSSEFQRSEVRLEHNLTNGVSVIANRRHVEEILSNLVINACHAIQNRSQKSEVGSQRESVSPSSSSNGLIGDSFKTAVIASLAEQGVAISGCVTVNAHKTNSKVIVEISDTGPGIPKENLARVFEPFFTTKGPKGSGLGLYITKQLVERNGGKISVKSKLGEGTSFRLEFKR